MELQSDVNELSTEHTAEKEKQGNDEHSKRAAGVGLADLITKKGRKACHMGNKSMNRHETANIEEACLECHRHPDGNISGRVM